MSPSLAAAMTGKAEATGQESALKRAERSHDLRYPPGEPGGKEAPAEAGLTAPMQACAPGEHACTVA